MWKNKCGFGLIEVLASVVILSIGLTTLMALHLSGNHDHTRPMRTLQAQYLAQSFLDKALMQDAWRHCSEPKNTDSICQYINAVEPLPVAIPIPGFQHFKMTIKLSPEEEIEAVLMRNLQVSIFLQQDILASLDTWVGI